MRDDSRTAADIIRERTGGATIEVGLVLSAGLATIADHVTSAVAVNYEELPGFFRPRFGNQVGQCVVGTLGSARVAVLKGRTHYHEHGDIDSMRVPIETLKLLGASTVVLTGAAGSVKKEISPGAFVALRDHINLTGINPLIGADGDNMSIDLSHAYDTHLRERFALGAGEVGRKTSEGTLMWFPGPELRDAGRDQRRPHARRRPRRHVDRAEDAHRPPTRPARPGGRDGDQLRRRPQPGSAQP